MARPRGQGALLGQLQAARLARLAPALLGLPDSGHLLREVRHGPGPGRRPAGRTARHRGLPAEGALAAGRGRIVGQRQLPDVPRQGPPRDRHDGHVRRLQLVLPALLRRPQRPGGVGPAGAPQLDARRPVHRRRRARDPAPDVLALLRQGARRHAPPRRAGAVPRAVHTGHDPGPRRQQDVELQGQRDRPERHHRALRRRRGPLLRAVHRSRGPGRGVVGHGHRRRAPEAAGTPVALGRRPGRRRGRRRGSADRSSGAMR